MRVALVVPHIFMHRAILPHVIFSPGHLALDLSNGLVQQGAKVTLFTPGPVKTKAESITADLNLFEAELRIRGDTYLDLLKKHPFTFITLARQVQSEILARAFAAANNDEFDIVHIYTNEEDIALPFVKLCKKPVVFTHHDPFNFLVKYKSVFPKYANLNWLSISYAQRKGMPHYTNWISNIYHGIDTDRLKPNYQPRANYIAYLGRIIQPKGLHLAIQAIKEYNKSYNKNLKLKIAGKHYAGQKDAYWQNYILPELNNTIEYVGFIGDQSKKQDFLGNARCLIIPSLFEEPFGMVMIEALACGTPLVGLNSGAISEVITPKNGILLQKQDSETKTAMLLAEALANIHIINRQDCRKDFEDRFTLKHMCQNHLAAYSSTLKQ